jgi:hypothetical protein
MGTLGTGAGGRVRGTGGEIEGGIVSRGGVTRVTGVAGGGRRGGTMT